MSRILFAAPALCALVLIATPSAQAQPSAARGAVSPQTSDFVAKAAATDAFEREAGRLAQKRSRNADVRAFGAKMVSDHTMTTDKLLQVLTKDHLPKPPKKTTPDPSQAKMMTDLVDAPKRSFDKAYAHSQVVVHKAALMMMQDYAMHGDNPDLKQLAAATAPLIRHHLDLALKLEGEVGGPSKSLTRKED